MAWEFFVEQKKFHTLEEFMVPGYEGMNNFHIHFIDVPSNTYRNKPVLKRFEQTFPGISRDLTATLTSRWKEHASNPRAFWSEMPYEKLWFAYELMSSLVISSDLRDPNEEYADRSLTK